MTDNMSPAKRAALLRNAEKARRLIESGREFEGMTQSERIERHAAAMEERYGVRNAATDSLNRFYERQPLRTGFEPAQDKEARKHEQLAKSFQYDERQEALLALKNRHAPEYNAIDTASKISLGYYERAKSAAKQLGRSTAKPKDDGNAW